MLSDQIRCSQHDPAARQGALLGNTPGQGLSEIDDGAGTKMEEAHAKVQAAPCRLRAWHSPKDVSEAQNGYQRTCLNMAPPFNPWTATIEEAQSLQAAHLDQADPEGPIFQWMAARKLESFQKRGLKNGFDVLEAVSICALHGLVMPEWLARGYLKRYRSVQQLHVSSWDDESAFGRPYPAGTQVAAARQRRKNMFVVVNLVNEFIGMHPDKPIDPEWERIGGEISKNSKEAQRLFLQAVKDGLIKPTNELRSKYG